jgi:hypothetical protein
MVFISHKDKFVFIACARTGSYTNYNELIKNYNIPEKGITNHKDLTFMGLDSLPDIFHTSIENVYNKFNNLEHNLDNYFKYAFVRNPWARFVSLARYTSYCADRSNEPGFRWAKPMLEFKTFEEFCKGFEKSSLKTESHFFPYTQQLFIDGKCKMDYIGRLEKMNEASKIINDKTGLNIVYPKQTNLNQNYEYRKYYNEETKNIIGNYYKDDIEHFKYTF